MCSISSYCIVQERYSKERRREKGQTLLVNGTARALNHYSNAGCGTQVPTSAQPVTPSLDRVQRPRISVPDS
jgi:hypothetical protein